MQTTDDETIRRQTIHALALDIDKAIGAGDTVVTAVPGLTLHRRTSAAKPMPCIYGFGLGMVAQGGKQAMLHDHVYAYRPGDAMLTTVDVPVVANVTTASAPTPFLGLVLAIEPGMVMQEMVAMDLDRRTTSPAARPVAFGPLGTGVLDALTRLVRLLDEPRLAPVLAPLVQREIVIRLLDSEFGAVLRQVVSIGSPSHRIAKAVDWLKQNFAQTLPMDRLAAGVHMSPSTFRHHFRKVTGMSPLQYQKQLRLQEARQLMLSQQVDAGTAGIRVGYDSASQFSREYARLFGQPPLRDIRRVRIAP